MATFEPEALHVLSDAEVRFVIIGAIALGAHGTGARLRVAAAVFGAGGYRDRSDAGTHADRDERRTTMALSMSDGDDRKRRPAGQWTAEEVAREQAATEARISRARARGPEANLKESAALARFANRVAAAAENARRRERG